MLASAYVVFRLPLSGVVVTWFVTGSGITSLRRVRSPHTRSVHVSDGSRVLLTLTRSVEPGSAITVVRSSRRVRSGGHGVGMAGDPAPVRGWAAARRADHGLHPPNPAAKPVTGAQGVQVLSAQDPLANGQKGSELVTGRGRVPGPPGPVGKEEAGSQGDRVWYLRADGAGLGRVGARVEMGGDGLVLVRPAWALGPGGHRLLP